MLYQLQKGILMNTMVEKNKMDWEKVHINKHLSFLSTQLLLEPNGKLTYHDNNSFNRVELEPHDIDRLTKELEHIKHLMLTAPER